MFSSFLVRAARGRCAAGLSLCQPFARAPLPPSETALGDRSHAVSTMNSVVERRKTGKMRLLAGFWPFQGSGPSRTGAFVWRNRPDCPYAEIGIDAILQEA